MKIRTSVFILLILALLMGLSAVILAQSGDPQTLFTDNVSSTGTSIAVTEMEQQLLNRLNAASTSIDASIYSLNRASIRDALINAHNRGVVVRVVADDDAYDEPGYKPHFQALEAAIEFDSILKLWGIYEPPLGFAPSREVHNTPSYGRTSNCTTTRGSGLENESMLKAKSGNT